MRTWVVGSLAWGLTACEPAPPVAAFSGPALVNGSFEAGLEGWTAEGDAASFRVFADARYGDRPSLTTFLPDLPRGGGSARGTLWQEFAVPGDAAALRFVVHGGHERVKLLDGDQELFQAVGVDDNDVRVPVSWPLTAHRGRVVRLAVEDRGRGGWGFISTSGFDVIRDVPCALKNADFADGLNGWDVEGDAASFNRFRDPDVGNRWSITSAIRKEGAPVDAARGTLSQQFQVPVDALALRFVVHGGSKGSVRLLEGDTVLFEARATDSNEVHVPVSWRLDGLRGRTVRLAIVDGVDRGPWGFLGVSGFDLVTSRNGP